MKYKFAFLLCGLLALAGGVFVQAAPLGTAISYQGRLDDTGSPANGTYSFRYRLLGDPVGTTQIGPVIDLASQPVSGGLLNAPLDFGASAFNGDARWLEISVKAGGPGAAGDYIKLNPQPLPPAGSSQFARVAGDVLNGTITGAKLAPLAITTTHISDGAVTTGKLGPASITSGNVADNAITGPKIANSQVVKSLTVNGNLLQDNVTLVAGANVTLSPSGNTVTISSAGPGGAGIWTALNGNAYYNGGPVGIGTATPGRLLQLGDVGIQGSQGLIRFASRSSSGAYSRTWDLGVPEGGDGDGDGRNYSFVIDDTALGTTPEFVLRYGSGNVGIGTTTPSAKLDVNGDGRFRNDLFVTRDLTIGGATSEAGLGVFVVRDWAPEFQSALHPRFIVRREGTVGIGIANPQAALQVVGNWDAGRPALQLDGQKPSLVLAGDGASGNRSWLVHLSGNGPGNLEFYNQIGAGGWRPMMSLAQNRSFLRVEGAGGEQAYIGGDGAGGDVQLGSQNAGVTHVSLYNAGNNTFMNLSARDVSCRVLTIYGGADLAEPFPMKEETIERGSVVVIDDEHPGRLKRSTRAYDTRVAGIVSGANGISPGIALKQEGALDQGQNVALSGRVYVQADASHGAIKPGDLLTTSSTPGHAMKVSDSARAQGAILGKAMTTLAQGKGLVLVLVTLQ